MTIFVTGAAGFIGSHLTERLLTAGHSVVALDNLDGQYSPADKRLNIEPFWSNTRFHFVEGDIRDQSLVADLLRRYRCQVVVHLAARTGVRASVYEPAVCLDVNVSGTLSVLEAMRSAQVSRLVMASSSSVYGNSPHLPFREDDAVAQPLSPYAMSKRSAELLAHTYHHLYGFDVACLRFFTVYGPRQRPEMAITRFTRQLLDGEPITLYGSGNTARNYTHVHDTVSGIVQAIQYIKGFNIVNIAGPSSTSLHELVQLLERATGLPARIDWQPEQPGDVYCTQADLRRAADQLHYKPSILLKDGLRDFVAWYQQIHGTVMV
ncbi:SDR family NAD(P)-dependent oxidoreductase [Spirosoma montaniterrae]|uniref:Epimerase n=1 Tax=Spirosoma montaniterrae TaxID=1178516 RepID=A0A1P9X183_9BACT|nr:SDR family NAD(P)-dependent oxidoreductase [Spirosoma montaniterrae]AQG81389.1 epimerase [Spirosoma montaniterrae]